MSSISSKTSHRETYLYVGQGLRVTGHKPAEGDQTEPVGTPSRLLAARSQKATQGPGPLPPHLMSRTRAAVVTQSKLAAPRSERRPSIPPLPYQDDDIRPATPLLPAVQDDEITPATPRCQPDPLADDRSFTESVLPLYEEGERPLPPNTVITEREITASSHGSTVTVNSQDANRGAVTSAWSPEESERPKSRRTMVAVKAKWKAIKLDPRSEIKRFASIFKRR